MELINKIFKITQTKSASIFTFPFLETEDKRAANVYAIGDVKCLSLDRHAFISLIGRIDDAKSSIAEEDEKELQVSQPTASGGLDKASLSEVRVLKSLGQGGFGDVKVVHIGKFKGQVLVGFFSIPHFPEPPFPDSFTSKILLSKLNRML